MPSYNTPKKNTAFVFYGAMVSQANLAINQSSPTLATGDFKVSIDGGALANLATLPTNTPSSTMVKFSLSAAEMNGDNITVVCIDAAGAEWCDLVVNIQTTARQIDDLAYPATSGRSMVVDAAGLVDANVVKVGPTGSGTAQTAGDIMADTNDIQTRLPAALVSGRMDSSVGAMANNTVTAAAIATDAIDADAIKTDAVTEIQSGLSTLTQANVRTAVGLSSANLDTQFINTIAEVAVVETLIGPAELGSGTIGGDLTDLRGTTGLIFNRLPSALTAHGNMKSSLVEIITTSLTEGATGRLKAAWTTLLDVASPVFTTASVNQTGDSFARLGAPVGADVSADVAAVKAGVDQVISDLEGAQAEPGQGTPAVNASPLVKLSYLYKAWRNRTTQTSSQYSLYGDDATTIHHKGTFSNDGSTADRGEITSGP